MICLARHGLKIPRRIMNRSGYIREGGRVLWYSSILEEPPRINLNNGKYAKITIFRQTISRELVEHFVEKFLAKNPNLKRGWDRGDIHLIFSEGMVIIGKPLIYRDTRSFYMRRPSIRPFFRSIALSVPFSRAMINLSRVREGMCLLDPFAGTGSILIEAGLMGLKPIGVEIDWRLVHGARENLEYVGVRNYVLILGDSRNMRFRGIDGIATDPPYGRAASTHGRDVEEIYERFIFNASEWLRDKGHMVFLAPHYMIDYIDDVLCSAGFITGLKIPYYIHGGLTRIIYVAYKP